MTQHIAGAVGCAVAAWFVWRGIAAARAPVPTEPLHQSLRALADIGPALVTFGLLVAGVEIVVAFVLTDGGSGLFSWFDLFGVLAALGGYGVWITKRSNARRRTPNSATTRE